MSDARTIIAAAQDEAPWQNQVLDWAFQGGWLRYAMHDSRKQHWRSEPGFPDLLLFRGTEHLAVELKTEVGQLKPHQERWLAALKLAGFEVYVWRPRDEVEVQARLFRGVAAIDRVRRAKLNQSRVTGRRPSSGRPAPLPLPKQPRNRRFPDAAARQF